MAWLLGIDIGRQSVRLALLRTGYRRLAVESLQERLLADYPSVEEAIKAAMPHHLRTESISTNIEGDEEFLRVVELPPTAMKQLSDVLPFELEAQLPFELDQTVYDSRLLPRSASSDPLRVLAVVARTEDIKARIDTVRAGAGHEPERVEPSCIALGNLVQVVPELQAEGPIAVAHLDADLTDVVFLRSGQVWLARTVTGGTAGLPASAAPLARDLRQTLMAWRAAGGEPPVAMYLTGPGATLSGADAYLSSEVGVPVSALPALRLDGITAETESHATRAARAIALALGCAPRSRAMNLRRGPLAYERGYGFLRERIPVLVGLAAVIAASFLFSTWTDAHTLSMQKGILEDALALVTKNVLGEATHDPQKAMDMIGPGVSGADDDPMPHMDAFDVMVQLSKAVPADVIHDVEEMDVQRGHVTINGVVPTVADTQTIAANLKEIPCFKNVKVVRTSQAVNDSKQKYVLEFDIKCPGEGDKDKKKDKDKEAAPADSAETATKEGK
jgi:general secretion pathway protein L